MKIGAKELALALGALALTRVASNTSTQNQHSPSVTEVRDSGKAATATIKIDGSITVYPITEAMPAVVTELFHWRSLCLRHATRT